MAAFLVFKDPKENWIKSACRRFEKRGYTLAIAKDQAVVLFDTLLEDEGSLEAVLKINPYLAVDSEAGQTL